MAAGEAWVAMVKVEGAARDESSYNGDREAASAAISMEEGCLRDVDPWCNETMASKDEGER